MLTLAQITQNICEFFSDWTYLLKFDGINYFFFDNFDTKN